MDIVLFIAAALSAGTPLLFATLGEILTEKTGNLNLGVEGMMLMGSVIGFAAAFYTGSPAAGVLASMFAGACGALIYSFLTVNLKANQVVCGLSLTIFGTGFSGFTGKKIVGKLVPDTVSAAFKPLNIPFLSDIPYLGDALFKQNILVYAAVALAFIMSFYINKTMWGLNLRCVGENPAAADSRGINVTLYKYVNILIGGALCGLGGGYLSLVYVPALQENVTTGRGWIAVALVIFSMWSPKKAILGAFLFGGLDIIGFRLQKYNLPISLYIFDMLPFVMTIVVLVINSVRKKKENSPPSGLSNPYFREER